MEKWIDFKLSIGHILQAFILVFGLGVFYSTITSAQTELRVSIATLRVDMDKLSDKLSHEYMRNDVANVFLDDLRERLKRIEQKVDNIH